VGGVQLLTALSRKLVDLVLGTVVWCEKGNSLHLFQSSPDSGVFEVVSCVFSVDSEWFRMCYECFTWILSEF
jgi:hypothetical protein